MNLSSPGPSFGVVVDGIFWTWDAAKNENNKSEHKVSFELAALVFEDPLHRSVLDDYPLEDRWRTVGQVCGVHLIVVHTEPMNAENGLTGRIIHARKAKPSERRAFTNDDE